MVEEGCENELENNRVTLQKIRQKTQTWSGDEESKNKVITQSELEASASDMKLSGLQDDPFEHLEQHD